MSATAVWHGSRRGDYYTNRMDKRIAGHIRRIDKIMAGNPLLKELVDSLYADYDNMWNIRRQAYGNVCDPDFDHKSFREYSDTYMRPVLDQIQIAERMVKCPHEHADFSGEFDICPDCGAVNYGLGWTVDVLHASTLLQNKESSSQGQEAGEIWA